MRKNEDTDKAVEEVKITGATGEPGATGRTGATGKTGPAGPKGTAGAVTVTSEEPGVVLTGTIAQAFEARILASVQKLFFSVFVLQLILFVILLGVGVFLTRLSGTLDKLDDTVTNTDKIVTAVAGPEAQKESAKAQAAVVQRIIDEMNCADQRNLQRAIDALVPNAESIVEPDCLKEP